MQLHFPQEHILSTFLENHPATIELCKKDEKISRVIARAFANSTKSAKDLRMWVVLTTLELPKTPKRFFVQNMTEALQEVALPSAL